MIWLNTTTKAAAFVDGDHWVHTIKAMIQANDERMNHRFQEIRNMIIDLDFNTKEDCVNN